MVTKQDIIDGKIKRGRVLYRETFTSNPKEIGTIDGDIIITRFAVSQKIREFNPGPIDIKRVKLTTQ